MKMPCSSTAFLRAAACILAAAGLVAGSGAPAGAERTPTGAQYHRITFPVIGNVRYTDDNGKEKSITERLELPADLANGIITTLLKNLPRDARSLTLPLVAATPKPRIVKLEVMLEGEDPFSIGRSQRKAAHYRIKINLGGVAGLVAPLLDKQPPDAHVWIMRAEAPAFVRSEGPLFAGGPIWRIELTSPVWPH